MTRRLSAGRRPAASGQTKSVVVFLHGYGADGNDLLGLAEALAPHLPDTLFVAPDAPEPCTVNPAGYQWFSIPWIDGSSEADARAGLLRAAADLDAFLDELRQETGVSPSQIVLFGFSQGTMMALHVAPRRSEPVAGVVGFSGSLLAPELLGGTRSRPPVLLLHGDLDEVVPPQSMPLARDALTAAGFSVATHVMPGTPHGIAPDGLGVALSFVAQSLGDRRMGVTHAT
jgi:phospholipase/carboxylesterase